MIDNLPTLRQLIKQLQQVPYLASRNLYRVTEHFLMMDYDKAQQFIAALLEAKKRIIKCNSCWAWQEKDINCSFCSDVKRDKSKVCVVENWQDLIALEKTEGYKGLYHVLGGAISPLEGITPDDLTIEQLISRITNEMSEVILALNQTPEGEATAAFIARKIEALGQPVLVSCLARGVPVGSVLEAMDRVTVYKALAERRPF